MRALLEDDLLELCEAPTLGQAHEIDAGREWVVGAEPNGLPSQPYAVELHGRDEPSAHVVYGDCRGRVTR